jgi:hypothetical protein
MQNDLVHLNVGGQRFSTSKRTLLSIQEDTFFTSLLSGRISSNVDETGAYFIDRDPTLFRFDDFSSEYFNLKPIFYK